MSEVERLQAAIDKLEALKAGSDPIRHDSTWVLDYDVAGFEHRRILVLDSHNGGYDGSIVADVTSEGRAQLIVTLHRTIDAQLAILRHAIDEYEPRDDSMSFITEDGMTLADAILGVTS